MRILVPLLSKQENNEFFLKSLPASAEEIILLLVIDTRTMLGQFGFAASDIAAGNVLMQLLRKHFVRRRRKCIELEEWGNTEAKIFQIAQLKSIDKIFLAKQDNEFYKRLVVSLREKLRVPIEEIALPAQQEKK